MFSLLSIISPSLSLISPQAFWHLTSFSSFLDGSLTLMDATIATSGVGNN